MYGAGRVFKRGRRFWIAYWHGGREFREPTVAPNKREAGDLLRGRLEALKSGRAVPDARKLTVTEAINDYLTSFALKRGDRAKRKVMAHTKPVIDGLGHVKLAELDTARIETYTRDRLATRKARGEGTLSGPTINRELAALRTALRLAARRGKLGRVPGITMLPESPPRQAYFDSIETFERFTANLTDEGLRDLAEAGYLLGWRLQELRGLRWEYVALDAKPYPEVRLPKTKNGDARMVPIVGPQLVALFERREARRRVTRKNKSTYLADLVFHRRGRRIGEKTMHRAWATALEKAELPRRTFHDLRRTAARDLVASGVPEHVAMRITGHRTASVFRRYAIVAQEDMAGGLEAREKRAEETRTNVVPIGRKAQKRA